MIFAIDNPLLLPAAKYKISKEGASNVNDGHIIYIQRNYTQTKQRPPIVSAI